MRVQYNSSSDSSEEQENADGVNAIIYHDSDSLDKCEDGSDDNTSKKRRKRNNN